MAATSSSAGPRTPAPVPAVHVKLPGSAKPQVAKEPRTGQNSSHLLAIQCTVQKGSESGIALSLFYTKEAADIGHQLFQALQEGHLLLPVQRGGRAAGSERAESVR